MIEKVKVSQGQNIVDLAIQEYGSIEGLLALARRNGLAIDGDPDVGSEVDTETTEVVNSTNRTFFKGNKVSTGRE